MWEQFTSFLLSNLIPASIMLAPVTPPVELPTLVDIDVQPLAVIADSEIADPIVNARAALVIETHSNEALYTQNVWEPLPIASLTKLMTALVVVDHLDLSTEVTVSLDAAQTTGSSMGLRVGEIILVEDLLKGLLISSGNDAAVALAEATSGTVEDFVVLMNERTGTLGLNDTRYFDPSGLNAGNTSSAFEVAHLAKQVFRNPFLSSVMREREIIVSSVNGAYRHTLSNTNRLLGTDIADRIIAGKTGTTLQAGQCLISFINGASDRTIMTIILGSSDRYGDVKNLIGWVDQSFSWE
jgi:D-alanyl-D-alanine carboxypeptidase (penicillin-binding protein 5/6)